MIETRTPVGARPATDCLGCRGTKAAPIAALLLIYHGDLGVTIALCEECGRDTANAVGYMCIRDGGWSKLEPRKRKASAEDSKEKGAR